MTIEEAWEMQEKWLEEGDQDATCLLDLRRRVESLEARAATEPAPAPAADRPLWEVMERIFYENGSQDRDDWVATINAVAEWLLADHPAHATAASRLHAEARRAQEGQ